MIQAIQQHANDRMQKCIENFSHNLAKLRTGRAHPSLLESLPVFCYGNTTPLNQVASIMIEDARTLLVTPWDKSVVQAIDKAIRSADLGLNPVTLGHVIRVPLPSLTEERRKELVRHLGSVAEEARVVLRGVRRDANTELKQLSKKKAITEDLERSGETAIQKLTDRMIAELEKMVVAKENELMHL